MEGNLKKFIEIELKGKLILVQKIQNSSLVFSFKKNHFHRI